MAKFLFAVVSIAFFGLALIILFFPNIHYHLADIIGNLHLVHLGLLFVGTGLFAYIKSKLPVITTRATVLKKHIGYRSHDSVTFLLPNKKILRRMTVPHHYYKLLKAGDEVMLSHKDYHAIKVIILSRKEP